MAKRNKQSSDQFPTLNKTVPHVISFTLLAVLFIVAVRLVRHALGVDF